MAQATGRNNPYLVEYDRSYGNGTVYQDRTVNRKASLLKDIPMNRNTSAPQKRQTGRNTAAPRSIPMNRSAASAQNRQAGRNMAMYRSMPAGGNVAPIRSGGASLEARRRRAEQRRRRRRVRLMRRVVCCGALLAAGALFWTGMSTKRAAAHAGAADPVNGAVVAEPVVMKESFLNENKIQGLPESVFQTHPEWEEDFLTPNEYSRPGDALTEVKNIFVHYTANPGTSAAQNRSYFEQLKDTHERGASAHFIIGYEGEIIQCVPLDEIAYAVLTRNEDSISIECCYKEKDGSFTQETYDSLIKLLAWLTDTYGLDEEDILRHYDCGGKKCPLYYTEHPDAWEKLKEDVAAYQ